MTPDTAADASSPCRKPSPPRRLPAPRSPRSHPTRSPAPRSVDLWEKSGLLQAMYTGSIDRCSFQQMAVITRYGALQAALKSGAKLVITERSIFTDRECFAKVGITQPADVAAYAVTHDALVANLPPIRMATILLDAPVDVIQRRIRMRGRSSEQDLKAKEEAAARGDDEAQLGDGGVPAAYLKLLQDAHVEYFASLGADEKRTVCATATPREVEEAVHKAIVELEMATSEKSVSDLSPVAAMPSFDSEDPLEAMANEVLDMDMPQAMAY